MFLQHLTVRGVHSWQKRKSLLNWMLEKLSSDIKPFLLKAQRLKETYLKFLYF